MSLRACCPSAGDYRVVSAVARQGTAERSRLASRINHEAQIALSLFVSFSPQGSHAFSASFHLLATHPPARWLQRIHDARLLWPLALQTSPSWTIAFIECCMAVPANRLGSAVYTTAQL